jgi:uncharacterized membrane protein YdbT with pleckstrin-like domain
MELMEGEHVLWEGRPSWRAHISYFVVSIPLALVPVIIASIVAAGDSGTGLPLWQWVLLSIALVVLVIAYDAVQRYSTLYVVTDQRLRVRHGILSRREQSARFERVQNVSISQSLMDRLLRVGAVEFDTAGTDQSDSGFRYSGIAEPQQLVSIVARHSQHPADARTTGL